MFNKVDEMSLLIYLFKGKNIVDVLCKYTGCDPKVYTKNQLIILYQHTISDLSRFYHIPGLFWNYFRAKEVQKTYAFFHKETTEEDIELEALASTLFEIERKIFNEEDQKRIHKLIDEYGIKEVKENE